MRKIRIAIVGVGNCASSLVQGINFYDGSSVNGTSIGLMHRQIGGYRPGDVEVVAAFDIDRRKVGCFLHDAAMAAPNCTTAIRTDLEPRSVRVLMGPLHDGVAPHMADHPAERAFRVSD